MVASLIAAGGALAGGLLASKGAKDASKAQAASSAADRAMMERMNAESAARIQPFTNSGYFTLPVYESALGLHGKATSDDVLANKFTTSPGYQFRLNEGTRALENSAAARGRLFSGGTGRAITDYAQGQASGEFGNWMNSLNGLINMGQNSAAGQGNLGLGYAGGISNAINNQGAATASGIAGSANAWQNAMSGVGQAFGNYFGQQQSTPGAGWNMMRNAFGTTGR